MPETIYRIRDARGHFIKGHVPWHKGKTDVYSEETKKKMSLAKEGKSSWNKGTKGIMKSWCKGQKNVWKLTEQQRLKKRETVPKGEQHYNWQGGKSVRAIETRKSLEYKLWREKVFKRDGYACIHCGDNKGGNLHADHIKPFAFFPELRFDINNGRTLCTSCHKKTETWGYGATKLYAR